MQTLIAILRGINVGGHRKVPMKELKELFESLGFREVITYIQSGNVVFRTGNTEPAGMLAENIGKAIREKFGFSVPVICRTKEEWKEAIERNPFSGKAGLDVSFLHVTFLEKAPEEKITKSFSSLDFPPERFLISSMNVYLYCPDGYGNAKLNNTFLESRLGVMATTRNWKTVVVLGEIAGRL